MTATIFLPSLGTAFAYLVVVCIYILLCYMAVKLLKRWGYLVSAGLMVIMVLQISHWHKLDADQQRKAGELTERSPEIYTFVTGKFKSLDKDSDQQVDIDELSHYKTDCSCNAGTVRFIKDNLDVIGQPRNVASGEVKITITRDDIEMLKQRAMESLQ